MQIRIRRDAVRRLERELLKNLEHVILGSGIQKYNRRWYEHNLNKTFATAKQHDLFDGY